MKHFLSEKRFIRDNIAEIVRNILTCYDNRYSSLYTDDEEQGGLVSGAHLVFDVCRLLNSQTWAELPEESLYDDEDRLRVQISAISKIYDHFKGTPALQHYTLDSIIDGFIDFVRYACRYFPLHQTDPLVLLSKVCNIGKNKSQWQGILWLFELSLCAPFSNASLERLFNQMKMVKPPGRISLTNDSLNALLRIRVTGPKLRVFNKKHNMKCVRLWYSTDRRRSLGKRKKYAKRNTGKKTRS